MCKNYKSTHTKYHLIVVPVCLSKPSLKYLLTSQISDLFPFFLLRFFSVYLIYLCNLLWFGRRPSFSFAPTFLSVFTVDVSVLVRPCQRSAVAKCLCVCGFVVWPVDGDCIYESLSLSWPFSVSRIPLREDPPPDIIQPPWAGRSVAPRSSKGPERKNRKLFSSRKSNETAGKRANNHISPNVKLIL